jgi:hypothetical protein
MISSMPFFTPTDWSCGVEGVLARHVSPDLTSRRRRSVKVLRGVSYRGFADFGESLKTHLIAPGTQKDHMHVGVQETIEQDCTTHPPTSTPRRYSGVAIFSSCNTKAQFKNKK